MATGNKLSGLNPLAYIGVEPSAPPQVRLESRRPTVNDISGFNIGSWWLMVADQEVWILIAKDAGVATWLQLYPGSGGGGGADAFPTDAGTANQAGGEVDILGGTNINTAGAGNTVTVNLNDNVEISGHLIADGYITSLGNINGVNLNASNDVTAIGILESDQGLIVNGGGIDSTGETRLRDLNAGVVQSSAVGVLFADNGTDGQVIIGGGAAPAWANITSTGGTITITEGANTINLEQTGGPVGADASFMAYFASQEHRMGTNVNRSFAVGSTTAMTELFDTASAFFPGDGAGNGAKFTAPVTGKYCFSMNLYNGYATAGGIASTVKWHINTTSINVQKSVIRPFYGGTYLMELEIVLAVSLTLGDTVEFFIELATTGSWGNIIYGTDSGKIQSWIHGYLID